MYQNVVVLSRQTHGDKRFQPLPDYGFARGQTLVPVAAAELTHVAARLPIGFMASEAEGLRPMVLMGIDGETNLLVGPDGRWATDYVPAAVRRYPFVLTRNQEGGAAVGIDLEANTLSDSDGDPLFKDDGEPGERLERIMAMLREFDGGIRGAATAAQRLEEAGVLEDWEPKVEVAGQSWTLKGLRRVSESALNALDDETFAGLRSGGALAMAYAQLLSTAQLPKLVRLAEARQKQTQPASAGKPNGQGNGEMSFNFDA